jgi:hypothetical protein
MISVIINNRDLLTWTKAMVDKIKTLDNVGEIFILDNASTYKPLLEWYERKSEHKDLIEYLLENHYHFKFIMNDGKEEDDCSLFYDLREFMRNNQEEDIDRELDEDNEIYIPEKWERMLVSYLCWKYSRRHHKDYPAYIIQDYKKEFAYQKASNG